MAKTGGLRSGTIYASLAVRTEEWSKGLKKGLGELNKFSSQVESIGSKLGGVGAAMAATIGGSVYLASKEVAPLGKALESIQRSGQDLANEIGAALAPAIQEMAVGIRSMVDVARSLNPELKDLLATTAMWTTGALLAAGAVGKMAALVGGLTQAFQFLLNVGPKAFKLIGITGATSLAPVLAIGAAVAGLVLAAGAVYRAWNDTSTGLADSVRAIAAKIGEWASEVGKFFERIFDGIRGFIRSGIKLMLDQVAALVRGIAKLLEPVAEFFGLEGAEEFLSKASKLTGDELLKGMERGAQAIVSGAAKAGRMVLDGAKVAGEAVGYGLTYAAGGVRDMFEDFIGKAKGLLFSGSPGRSGGSGERPQWWKIYDDIQAQLIKPLRDANLAQFAREVEALGEQMRVLSTTAIPRLSSAFDLATAGIQEGAAKVAQAAAARVEATLDYANGLIEQAVGKTGTAGNVAMGAMQGAAVAGPWGAVAGGAVALLGETQSLQALMDALQPILDALIGILDAVLMPIIDALAPVFETIGIVLEALKPAIEGFGFGIELLKPILELVANVIAGVVRVIGSVWNGIIDVVAGIVGIFDKSAAEWLKAKKMNLGAMDAALARIGQEERIADEASRIADKLADADQNIPAGWRRNLAAYHAMDAGPYSVPGAGGGGTNVYIDTITTGSPRELAEDLELIMEHQRGVTRRRRTGSRLSRGSVYVT